MTFSNQALGQLVDVVLDAPEVGVEEIADHQNAVGRCHRNFGRDVLEVCNDAEVSVTQ